jgi:hypothetical protein
LIWRDSLDTGLIPNELKRATIIPIHKGDSRALPKNYRPISLTSHIIKIFERILRTHLVNFLEDNNIMNSNQHGFRAGRSCLSQLIAHYDYIIDCLEEGLNVDVVYLDFAKAFDKVDHGVLLHKLRTMGVGDKVGIWLHSFLSDRTQSVLVNGFLSEQCKVISSVPQGTVLGPILFLAHIADIDSGLSSRVSSFADDTRISRQISSIIDFELLLFDLQKAYEWQQINNMMLNEKKFETLRYGKNKDIKLNTNYLTPTGQHIESKKKVKDLGVIMNDTANFSDHIEYTCIKVR